MTAEEKLVEEVADAVYVQMLEKYGIALNRLPAVKLAIAVIPIVANYAEQRCWEAVIAAMGNETKASQKRVLDAFRTVRTALESIGKERG